MEGCHNATTLFHELQARGYPATQGPVAAWLRARRLQVGEDPRLAHTNLPLTNSSSILPSAYKLSWLIVLPPAKLTQEELALLGHLRQDAVVDQFYELAQAFRLMVTQRLVEQLDDWLKAAANSPLKTVRYFGKFLQDEYRFIRAALEHEWSNGQTEGQVNRLKFIKRQMYGRASFDLLRQKVLYHPLHNLRKTRFGNVDMLTCAHFTMNSYFDAPDVAQPVAVRCISCEIAPEYSPPPGRHGASGS